MDILKLTSAAQLIDPAIHTDAPIYALDSAAMLGVTAEKGLFGDSRPPRFPVTNEARVVDAERNIRWEPLPRPLEMHDWGYGRVTMPAASVPTWFYDYTYNEDAEALIPEILVWGELIVSARVKDLIESFAPEFCYFSQMKLIGQKSGQPHPTTYFKVLVRHWVSYIGSKKYPLRRQIVSKNPVNDDVWAALCENETARIHAATIPIFLFKRNTRTPILNAALYRHLKAHNVSGLLEYAEHHPRHYSGERTYETVFPLLPGPDVPQR